MNTHVILIAADPSRYLQTGPVNDICHLGQLLADQTSRLQLWCQGLAAPTSDNQRWLMESGQFLRRSSTPFTELARESWGERAQLFIFISGDGSLRRDTSGDEISGYDSVVGTIVDDDIYAFLRTLPTDAEVLLFIDACHSGSGADLPYVWSGQHWQLATRRPWSAPGTTPTVPPEITARVVGISSCYDTNSVQSEMGDWYGGLLALGLRQGTWLPQVFHRGLTDPDAVRHVHQELTAWCQ